MQKIKTMFLRKGKTQLVSEEPNPHTTWVFDGKGEATVKLDGTCCLVKDNKLWRRLNLSADKVTPGWVHWSGSPEAKSGHGWVPVSDDHSSDVYHREGWAFSTDGGKKVLRDGTYELIGEKVAGNPYNICGHQLIPHGEEVVPNVPRTFNELKDHLTNCKPIEGYVFHYVTDSGITLYAKIKSSDFGIKWPAS